MVLPSDKRAFLRGSLALLNGLSILLLALIAEAYRRGDILPWTSVSEFDTTVGLIMHEWVASADLSELEIIAYSGLSVAILGPILFWVAFPLIRWRYGPDIPLIGRPQDHQDQYFWPPIWEKDK